MKYAEILNGRVRYIGEAPTLPVLAAPLLSVSVDNIDPEPTIGDNYAEGTFTAQPRTVIKPRLSRLQFLNRFKDAELAAIYTAAKTNVAVEILLDKVRAAEYIDLADPQTIAGVEALEAAGLVSVGRAAEILG